MKVIKGDDVQRCAADGTLIPMGPRVLVRAIHEEHASELSRGIALDVRDAVAFEVMAIGAAVPRDYGLEVGQIVIHTSAASDTVDHTDAKCPFQMIHFEDIIGRVP